MSSNTHASIKHELESDGKTTALHARVLAQEDVKVYNWKDMPEYSQPERVLMLFPGPVSSVVNTNTGVY